MRSHNKYKRNEFRREKTFVRSSAVQFFVSQNCNCNTKPHHGPWRVLCQFENQLRMYSYFDCWRPLSLYQDSHPRENWCARVWYWRSNQDIGCGQVLSCRECLRASVLPYAPNEPNYRLHPSWKLGLMSFISWLELRTVLTWWFKRWRKHWLLLCKFRHKSRFRQFQHWRLLSLLWLHVFNHIQCTTLPSFANTAWKPIRRRNHGRGTETNEAETLELCVEVQVIHTFDK